MSKTGESPNGAIQLLEDPKIAAKRIKSAVTDAGTEIRFDPEEKPGVSNLLTIYSALTGKPVAELEAEYQGKMYGHLKVDLAEVVVDFITPLRNRTNELMADPAELDRLLALGRRTGARDRLGHAGPGVRAHGLPAVPQPGRSPLAQCPPSANVYRQRHRRALRPATAARTLGNRYEAPIGRSAAAGDGAGPGTEGISVGVILGFPAEHRGGAAALAGVLRGPDGRGRAGAHHACHHHPHPGLGGHPPATSARWPAGRAHSWSPSPGTGTFRPGLAGGLHQRRGRASTHCVDLHRKLQQGPLRTRAARSPTIPTSPSPTMSPRKASTRPKRR